jgi:hypothetical protein
MCNGVGAMYIGNDVFAAEKIVATGPAYTIDTKSVSDGYFACCTSKECNYADRGFFGKIFGGQVDSSKITMNSQGVCVGPPHGCTSCDGTQLKGSAAQCARSSGSRSYSSTLSLLNCKGDGCVDTPSNFKGIIAWKLVLVAWVFYLFLYTIYYKGAQWHTGGNGMCPWWFRCTCFRPGMWKLKTKCVPRSLHSPRAVFGVRNSPAHTHRSRAAVSRGVTMSQKELCYFRLFGVFELYCLNYCGGGETPARKARKARIRYAFERAYFDRTCWHYLMYAIGLGMTFMLKVVTSGVMNPSRDDSGRNAGYNHPDSPQQTLVVYNGASSWGEPFIIVLVGSLLTLPLLGPVGVLQNRVAAHFKNDESEESEDDADSSGAPQVEQMVRDAQQPEPPAIYPAKVMMITIALKGTCLLSASPRL